MRCDILEDLVLLALVLSLIGDIIALIAELVNRSCEKQEKIENKKSEEALNTRLTDIERRLSQLEKS